MKRFVEGVDRSQSTLFPDRLDDWIGDDNPVRVVDIFVDELDLGGLGFSSVIPKATGRPESKTVRLKEKIVRLRQEIPIIQLCC